MKKVIDFLSALRLNNHRDWFEANKSQYREALAEFNAFGERLIAALGEIDPTVRGLTLKDCTYRIYRDVRFSADKSPYKTYMGLYVCPHWKKSGYAGYYFHVQPHADGFAEGSLITSGLYMPDPVVLRSIRDDLLDHGETYQRLIDRAEGFTLYTGRRLKRTPTGYPADSPHDELLRLKDLYVEQLLPDNLLLADDLLQRVIAEYRKTVDLCALLNRSVEYAHQEMMR
jgi:uncharacterized protein (TIGR02453 family)